MKKKNKFKKIFTRDDINIKELVKRENIIIPYIREDFDKFLIKFCGSFIYRGKKAYSFKMYEYLLLNIKKHLKKNPIKILESLVKILMPFLILGKKSFRGKMVNIPIFAKGNKKNIIILNSIIKQFKNRSNIRGYHRNDILKVIIDTYQLKGSAINFKKDHYLEARNARRNLKINYSAFKFMKERKKKDKRLKIVEMEKKFFEDHEMKYNEILGYNLKRHDFNITEKTQTDIYKTFLKTKKKNGNKKRV